MHELSIALSILDLAEEEAEKRGVQVEAIHLQLGPLAGVVKAALLSAYEMAREHSTLAGCRLVVEEVPILMNCGQCGGPRPVASVQEMVCRECAMPATEIVQGKELTVVGLEVNP